MPANSKKYELLVWPVFYPFRQTLAEQAHDILCREIHAGRWKEGERLPSIVELAGTSGLGRGPIQRAFEMLREEGYVSLRRRTGTTLLARLPRGAAAQGAIGVAMRADFAWGPEPVDILHLHVVLEAALRRNCVVETALVANDAEWQRIDTAIGPFSDRVLGIVALYPFPHSCPERLAPERIPVAFLLDPGRLAVEAGETFLPHITGDMYDGFYQLTQKLIDLGHRKIAFFASQPVDADYSRTCWRAHERAMNEAGLHANREAFSQSAGCAIDDTAAIKDFLDRHADATAILCEKISGAHKLIALADLLGIRVPEDLSIVAQGHGMMRPGDPSSPLYCLQYDMARAAEICLDLLFEMARSRTCPITRAMVRPVFVDGRSLARPRQNAALEPVSALRPLQAR